jgi:tripartite motif-containing protein 71
MASGFKRRFNWLMAIVLLMGTISINLTTKAYAAAVPSSDGIHEITVSGAFTIPANGEFMDPSSVTTDVYGKVYVLDTENNRIQKFDSSGTYDTQWGSYGSDDGQFDSPTGIAVDTVGNVYVADKYNNRIQKFDSSGTYRAQWGGYGSGNGMFSNPSGIAVDAVGNVYVADTYNNRIQKFDSDGRYLAQWGIIGSGNGQLWQPIGIAVDTVGNVYVADSNNNRIQKFNSEYAYDTQWGIFGTDVGQFNRPYGISVDAAGNVYVADTNNNRIQKIEFNDGIVDYVTWGSEGSGDGEFSYPSGITVDAAGNVYVADTLNNRIQKFDSSGTYETQWGHYGSTYMDIYTSAAVSDGNVYVADKENNRVVKFDSSGAYLAQWGSTGSGNGELDYPIGIAVDIAGNVYVADSDNDRIQKFSSSGTYLDQWGSYGTGEGQFNNPKGIAVDIAGNVYVADSNNNRIQKIEFNDGIVDYVTWGSYGTGEGQFDTPSGITVDAAGNVYVADEYNNRIQKFDSSGTYDTQWGSSGAADGLFSGPEAVTVDKYGNVYVVDYYNQRIQKFAYNDTDTDNPYTYLTKWESGDGIYDPVGVTVDHDGNLYEVESGEFDVNLLRIFSPNNSTDVTGLALSSGTLSPSFTSSNTGPYMASVAASVDAVTITPVLADPMATVIVSNASGPITGVVSGNATSYSVPLNAGANLISVTITAFDGTTQKAYTIDVTRAAASIAIAAIAGVTAPVTNATPVSSIAPTAEYTATIAWSPVAATFAARSAYTATITLTPKTGYTLTGVTENFFTVAGATTTTNSANAGVVTAVFPATVAVPEGGTPPSNGGGGSPTPTPTNVVVTSTVGNITLPAGRSGEVSLGDAITINIPADATGKEMKLTIEKVLNTENLLTNEEVLASPIYEILKNFSENFTKPVTLTFVFDPSSLKSNQRAVVFYYDEVKKVWVEVGGKVSGDKITVDVNHFTKFAVLAVDQAVDVPTDTTTDHIFSDISGHWAETSIKQAVSSGIVKGYLDGTFKPSSTVTRAEFAVMLMNALKPQGEGAELTFTDKVKIGTWAQKAVSQAVQAGIIKGHTNGTFGPNAEITRAEMAAMIAIALGQSIEANVVTGFADEEDIPAWAKGSIAYMKQAGIMQGKSDNEFAPQDHATRAEAVTVLLNMLVQMSK